MSETKKEPKLVEVTLAKRHTHAGVDYDIGAKIQVTEPEKAWLVDNKIVGELPQAKDGAK